VPINYRLVDFIILIIWCVLNDMMMILERLKKMEIIKCIIYRKVDILDMLSLVFFDT